MGAGGGCLGGEGERGEFEDGLVPDGGFLEVLGFEEAGDLLVDLGGETARHFSVVPVGKLGERDRGRNDGGIKRAEYRRVRYLEYTGQSRLFKRRKLQYVKWSAGLFVPGDDVL